ncbi:hypothetical protein [Streptacidiphilus cavernicola]|uniref:Holin n=1 Tax=Streptacidiphilus cavernicola TaxID=3342716 RepID=A0ABV6VNU1_9ACTN
MDVVERAAATYLETFLGLLLASGVLDVSALKAAAVAAVPAALSVIKSAVSVLLTGSGAALQLRTEKGSPRT